MENRQKGIDLVQAAAKMAVVFTVGLNTSVTFAKSSRKLPVIGDHEGFQFRSYETEKQKTWKNLWWIFLVYTHIHDSSELESSINSGNP